MTATPGRVTAYPRIPGHEVAGEVAEVGSEVTTIKVGDRVTCHFYLTCKVCPFCRSGRETLCSDFKGYVGMACDGGYAEYMAIPAVNVCPIPQGVTGLEAAIGADAICTPLPPRPQGARGLGAGIGADAICPPLHACREEARIGPGDRVLIVGAGGGVGIHAVQMAKLCGGYVLAADLSDAKLEMARAVGADEVIDVRREELSKQVLAKTDGRGVDAAIDMVAASETLEGCVRSLARAGRLVIIGNRPAAVFGKDPTFSVDPQLMLNRML